MITFRGDGLYNSKFDDIYFNTNEPLIECEHTYSSVLDEINAKFIVVAEAGFGTGLNFFSTVLKFLSLNSTELHYIAVEKYPFKKSELREIYLKFEILKPFFDEFIEQYEILDGALIRIKLLNERVILDLYFGDILDAFDELSFRADAWYLDGFSPTKNPDMWSKEVFDRLSKFCKNRAKVRTFSSAKIVQNRFLEHGFNIKKLKGHYKKREILEASLEHSSPKILKEPWYALPNISKFSDVLIIGAGVAGLAAAFKFKKAGFNVCIAEKMSEAATNGSSNLAGILMPLITKPKVALGNMHMSAFLFARHFYANSPFADFCGVYDYGVNDLEKTRLSLWDSEIFKFENDFEPYPRAFIKSAAQIRPKELCMSLASEFDIKYGYEFESIEKSTGGYVVKFKNSKNIFSSLVIFAMGDASTNLFQNVFADEFMQLSSVRGQVTYLNKVLNLNSAFSARGYMCKDVRGIQVVGATYDRNDNRSAARATDDEKNIDSLSEFITNLDVKVVGSNVGFRGYSGDRFPIVGAVHNASEFKKIYKSLLWTKHSKNNEFAVHHENILISSAHGSRGLGTAIFGAEILLDIALNRPVCTTNSILNSLNPARFLVRKLKRGLVR